MDANEYEILKTYFHKYAEAKNNPGTHPNKMMYAELDNGGVSIDFVLWLVLSRKQGFIEGLHKFIPQTDEEFRLLSEIIALAKEEL